MVAIKQAAIIGGGVIGAGWISRLIENGIDVTVYDPADDAAEKVEAVLKNSRYAYGKLTSAPRCSEGEVRFCDSIADAVSGAELIVESVPERLDIKQSVYAEIEATAASDALIASSTSGIMPMSLTTCALALSYSLRCALYTSPSYCFSEPSCSRALASMLVLFYQMDGKSKRIYG